MKQVHRIVFRPRWFRIIVGLWLFAMIGSILFAAWSEISGSMQPLFWWWAIVLLPAVIAFAIGLAIRSRPAIKGLRERFRYCSACHYDLRGTPVGADGLTICPECAAAWKLDRIEAAQPTRNG